MISMRVLRFLAIVFLVSIWSLSAMAKVSRKKPIKVNPEEMEAITFSRLIVRPDMGLEIGIAPDEVTINIIEELRKHGHNAVGAENLVFGIDESVEAQLVLGGTIKSFKCYRHHEKTAMSCDIGIDWELYDKGLNTVVYKVLTRCRIRTVKKQQISSKGIYKLTMGALKSLLSRERFVSMVKKKDGSFKPKSAHSTEHVRECDNDQRELPAEASEVAKATVLVKVGNALGSGFFFSNDGLILTADHVVRSSKTVTVKTIDGTELEATVIRRDRDADLAVLKVSARASYCLPLVTQLPPIGAELFAFGAPAGEKLAFSVTRGILSGIREIDGRQLLQTDAALNPGSSGGPLVNEDGEAVGVVTGGLTKKEFEGIGFAVPASAGLEEMGLIVGDETTVKDTVWAQQENDDYPIVDKPDPKKVNPIRAMHLLEMEKLSQLQSFQAYRALGHLFFWGGAVTTVLGGFMLARNLPEGRGVFIGGSASTVLGIILGVIYLYKKDKILREIKKIPMVSLSKNSDSMTLSLGWTF